MSKQNYLVELIRALNTNEKRYFKLFSSVQPGEKRYLKLFDALEGKNSYNISELCKEMGLTAKQLTDVKYYLTQTLLQSLQNFDRPNGSYIQLQNNKESVRTLMLRRQFAFALDILERNLERAWELEAFELIPEMLSMRARCLFGISRYVDDLQQAVAYNKCNEVLKELFELQDIANIARKYHAEANSVEKFEALLKHNLLANGLETLASLRAKLLYYEVWINYYIITYKRDVVTKLQREEQTLYKQSPILKVISPAGYVTNELILSSSETTAGNHEIACQMLEALGKELDKGELELTPQQLQSLRVSVASFKLWPLRHLGRYTDAIKVVQGIYEAVSQRSEIDKFTVLFEYSLSLLLVGHAESSLKVLDELFRIKPTVRADMQPYIRVISLMVQMSLGNYAVVPYQVKSTKAWLKKQNVSNPEFDLLFKHFLQIAQAADRRTAWKKLTDDLAEGKLKNTDGLIQLGHWAKVGLGKRG